MQQGCKAADAPGGKTERHNAHILDARIGQHSLNILNLNQIDGRNENRKHSRNHYYGVGPRLDAGARNYLIETENTHKTGVHQHARKQRSGRRGCLVFGVDAGGVHRHKSEFGRISHKDKHKGDFNPERVEGCGHAHQAVVLQLRLSGIAKRDTQKQNADEHEHKAD